MIHKKGIILKGIGGFYYVYSSDDDKIYECKARGAFRNNGQKPVAGDKVEFTDSSTGYSTVDSILQRKNILLRPPIANLDQLFIVSSVLEPSVNTLLIDQLIVIAESLDIEPIIIFSKSDLGNTDELLNSYIDAGFKTYAFSIENQDIIVEKLRSLLNGCISAFIGNSGVGKSTLINCLFPELKLATGKISKKLGRGKHTTRQVELFRLYDGFIADTPGFSSLDLLRCIKVDKYSLSLKFRDFAEFREMCKFSSCSHTGELGCAVFDAVKHGKINQTRYDNYVKIYSNLKDNETWK